MAMSRLSRTMMLMTEKEPNMSRPKNLVNSLIPVCSKLSRSMRPKIAQNKVCDVSQRLKIFLTLLKHWAHFPYSFTLTWQIDATRGNGWCHAGWDPNSLWRWQDLYFPVTMEVPPRSRFECCSTFFSPDRHNTTVVGWHLIFRENVDLKRVWFLFRKAAIFPVLNCAQLFARLLTLSRTMSLME